MHAEKKISLEVTKEQYQESLKACSIQSWYPEFEKYTFPSRILPLPSSVIKWVTDDGFVVPEDSSAFPTRNRIETPVEEDDYRDWSTSSQSSEGDTDSSDEGGVSSMKLAYGNELLKGFNDSVQRCIEDLGGSVFPKITWSAPLDAVWIATGNTLRCTTSDEVMLLLKSSDRVAHDLTDALYIYDGDDLLDKYSGDISKGDAKASSIEKLQDVQHVLALREWFDLKPGREFRCFVLHGQLRGISQRDITQKYVELDSEMNSIRSRLIEFHEVIVAGNFPLDHYTYDCYVPTKAKSSIRIIDFNPAFGTTSALLFSWEELLSTSKNSIVHVEPRKDKALSGDINRCDNKAEYVSMLCVEEDEARRHKETISPEANIEFRIISEELPIRPAKMIYGVPYDFVDDKEGGALSALLEQAENAGDLWAEIQSQCHKTSGIDE